MLKHELYGAFRNRKFLTYDTLPVMVAHAALIVISLIPYVSRAVSKKDSCIHT